jgi:hypothetical protein
MEGYTVTPEGKCRVFQVVPGMVDVDSGEMEHVANYEELAAYPLEPRKGVVRTDVEAGGKKFVLTITIEEAV